MAHIKPLKYGYVIFILLVTLLAGCVATQAEAEDTSVLNASGFIEGEDISIASEIGGHIITISAERGDEVNAGDLLVQLDDVVFQSTRTEAEATLATALANLALVKAGTRPAEIAAARAALTFATVQRDGADKAVLDAQDIISQPLTLNAEINGARAQMNVFKQAIEMAKADLAAVQLKRDVYADRGGDVKRVWDLQVLASEAALTQAQAELDGVRAYLGTLIAIREEPLVLIEALHQAENAARLAVLHVAAAEAQVATLEAGPTKEAVAVAEAQVRLAEKALDLIDVQIAQLSLIAPMDGIVSNRTAKVGETAVPGEPLLTLTNIEDVNLVLYIPAHRIGEVQIGQKAEVSVDSFPVQTFTGTVVDIANQAEFTPRNVQTQEERVNLVFTVKVRISNSEHLLKPGMPADAVLK
jgi:multidrug resistance efflux pump